MKPEVEIMKNPDAVAARAAECFLETALACVAANGRFTVALSGGSTPERLYRLLTEEPFATEVPWNETHLFWGDERNVAPDSDQSNYRMVKEALLARVAIPGENVHRVPTESGDPSEIARMYEDEIRGLVGAAGQFDLILLGMGDDGHTASLFPGTAALEENERLFVENEVPQMKTWRFTVTPPFLLRAQQVLLLVTGGNKADTLRQVFEGDASPPYPVQIVNARAGSTTWLLDEGTAKGLSTE